MTERIYLSRNPRLIKTRPNFFLPPLHLYLSRNYSGVTRRKEKKERKKKVGAHFPKRRSSRALFRPKCIRERMAVEWAEFARPRRVEWREFSCTEFSVRLFSIRARYNSPSSHSAAARSLAVVSMITLVK